MLRAGAGMFYGRVEPALTLDVLRTAEGGLQHLLIDQPGFFPNVPPNLIAGQEVLPIVYVRAPDLQAPQTLRLAARYERQLPKNSFVSVGYDVQDGRNQLRMRNTNAPGADGQRPDPARGLVLQYESTGRSRRHELTAGFRWQPSPWVSGFANYSFLDGRSDTDGRTTAPADSYRLESEYGYTLADLPHQVSAGLWLAVPGGFIVSPYFTMASGRAFNITTGFDNNGDGLFMDRPAVGAAGGPNVVETPYGFFDLAPGPADEIILRNAGREPRQIRLDLNASRQWLVGGTSVYLAVDVQNVFNRANFAGFNGVLTSPNFDRPNLALNPRRASISFGVSF
jgi:hypothetical protein